MASTATMSAQAADYQWFGPTDPANGSGTLPTTTTYATNLGVAFKTGASGPYRMQWVKLNLSSGLASSNITVKLSLRDTTDSTAYSAVVGANEYAVNTLNITTPTPFGTPFTLNLDPTTIPNIAAYTMSADTSYALILNGASANLSIRRTGGYAPNTTNNYYTLNDGFTVLNTFKNTATYTANSTNYPSLHFFFGTWQVTYDANNATSGTAPSSQPKYAGVGLTLAANSGTLARTGYTFAGWNTAAIGDGTDYAEGATYSAEASPTIYAKWAAANTIPTVTAISPTSGSTLGGTAVTITGTDLTGASAVTIGGGTCSSVNASATSITCTTPVGAAGTASVLVTTSGGTNAANTLFTYVVPPAPTVTAISPVKGTTLGSTAVTITGTNLTAASAVTIGGSACTPVNVLSASSITCTTPVGTAGTASVLVTTSGGTNAANTLYTYVTPPTVTAISPTSGSILGGTFVTIAGSNLTGASPVTIGGAGCGSVTVVSDTSITCITSALAAGTASVRVTTSGGSNTANTLFTYIALASQQPLTNVSAQASSLTPGATGVTFTLKFTTATRPAIELLFTFPNNFVLPAITGYSVKLDGVSQNMSTFASVAVTYNCGSGVFYCLWIAPKVAVLPGSTVEITLPNGVIPNPVTSLQFNGFCTNDCASTTGELSSPAPSLTLPVTTPDAPTVGAATAGNSQVSVNWTAPASNGGAAITGYQVQVSTSSGGTYADAAGTCAPASTGSSTAVTCTATGLTNGTQYFFKVAAINSVGTGSYSAASSGVTPPPAPTVTTISPTSGSTLGGTAVTITGADLTGLTGASTVTIGGAACTSVNASATSITCSTSALAAGTASVLVTTSGGTNAANTLFTYITPNVIVKLNDSGVTQCTSDGLSLVACSAANTGNAGTYPRQDARFGRDAAQAAGKLLPAKTGGGAAGFDFTPLDDASGNAIALNGPPSTHACVHDNVTNLTWEVKTTSGLRSNTNTYTWYNGRTGDLGTDTCGGTLGGVYADQCNINNYALAVNAAGLCGNHNPWRVPTRRELLSIVHYGTGPSSSVPIDRDYFPNTDDNTYSWTSDIYVPDPSNAWIVYFESTGDTWYDGQQYVGHVRLVRSGQ